MGDISALGTRRFTPLCVQKAVFRQRLNRSLTKIKCLDRLFRRFFNQEMFVGVMVILLAFRIFFSGTTISSTGRGFEDSGAILYSKNRNEEESYLVIHLCKGLCNQILELHEGIFLAYLLNLTFVLPDVIWNYEPTSELNKLNPSIEMYDIWQGSKRPMGDMFDISAISGGLKRYVKIVTSLPRNLDLKNSPSLRVSSVNPQQPSTLQYYKKHLRNKRVLRIACPLLSLKTNTLEGGMLHQKLLTNLHLSPFLKVFVSGAVGKRLGIHLRVEADWKLYCQSQAQDPGTIWVKSFDTCYKSVTSVIDMLKRLKMFESYPSVYVASDNVFIDVLKALVEIGFQEVESFYFYCNPICVRKREYPSGLGREARAAIDFFTMVNSNGFIGNVFSSFSLLVNQARSFRMVPKEYTQYYNSESNLHEHDLSPLEARRTYVFPGILRPELYCNSWRSTMRSLRLGFHNASTESQIIQSIKVTKIKEASDLEALASIRGEILMSLSYWYPPIQVLVDDQLASEFIANDVLSDPENIYKIQFDTEFSYKSGESAFADSYKIQVCAGCDGYRKCSQTHKAILRRPLQIAKNARKSILYVIYPSDLRSGGPESLHRLHQIVNKLFEQKQIDVASVYPTGVRDYETKYSNYTSLFDPSLLTSSDFVLFPEGAKIESWWGHVFEEVGVIPLVYYLGQHHPLLLNTNTTRQFKSICLTRYFSILYHCSSAAVLNTNMNPTYVLDSLRLYRNKTDTVIIDPDPEHNLDITRIKLPIRARLVILSGMNQQQVKEAYMTAKVYVDTFLTGRERSVFESVLYDVVPIIGRHSGGEVFEDYPLPDKYKWNLFNYEKLNALINSTLQYHDEAIQDFKAMKDYVRGMEQALQESAGEYFVDNFLIVLSGISTDTEQLFGPTSELALLTLLTCKDLFPFSGVEIIVPNKFYFEFEFANFFHELRENHHRFDLIVSSLSPEFVQHGKASFYLQTPMTKHAYNYYIYLGGARPLTETEKIIIRKLVSILRSDKAIDFVKCSSIIGMTREAQLKLQSVSLLKGHILSLEGLWSWLASNFRVVDFDDFCMKRYHPDTTLLLEKHCDCPKFHAMVSGNYWMRYSSWVLRRGISDHKYFENAFPCFKFCEPRIPLLLE